MRKGPAVKIDVLRIIDANINRSKEGLRVCEEVARFILNSSSLTGGFKKIRHQIDSLAKRLPSKQELLKKRRSLNDVGKEIFGRELKRKNCQDIFFANIQRVEESLRVLEEFSKLSDTGIAVAFKRLRYGIYEIEKKVTQKLISLSDYR